MKIIKTTKGEDILVSDEDYEWLNVRKWSLNSKGYAVAGFKEKVLRMHRVIMQAETGQLINHINRNRADNQRENLRFATHGLNSRNRKGASSSGLNWNARYEAWYVSIKITVEGKLKKISLGYFKEEDEASKAYKVYFDLCMELQAKNLSQKEVYNTLHVKRCKEREESKTRGWRVWSKTKEL